MKFGQNALVSINLDCCLACAWLHETNIKFLRFFMSDGLSSLNLRAAIRGHNRMFFLLDIEMFSLPYSKPKGPPQLPHLRPRAAAFWVQPSLSDFFTTHPTFQAAWTRMCCSRPSVPLYLLPPWLSNHIFSLKSLLSISRPSRSHLTCSLFPTTLPHPPAWNDLPSSSLLTCIICPVLNVWMEGRPVLMGSSSHKSRLLSSLKYGEMIST